MSPENATRLLSAVGLIASVAAVGLAVIGRLLVVNEYAAQGIPGAYDCDGPVVVGFFLIPAVGIGILGIATSVAVRQRAWVRTTALLLCAVALLLALTGLPEWHAELARNAVEGSPCL